MPRALVSKPPPMVTIDNRNQSLVISVVTIDTMIRRVFVNQGISADILFRRCIGAPGLTKKDPKAHSEDLVRCSGKRLTQIGNSSLMMMRLKSSEKLNRKQKSAISPPSTIPKISYQSRKWRAESISLT
ncbi:hypothetical protein PIB30_002570 [Stylosanthes scabra]|uniref:Uncharacterized protein n=1 Tax=Stylosanthes scabra TaxID=79078 RepID=A0ABU6Z0T9_9FABA|nr:hypothetical protein [Stylosanthes scabra]